MEEFFKSYSNSFSAFGAIATVFGLGLTALTVGNLIQCNTQTYETWLSLKESSRQLKIVIGDWLIDNGIDEHNIREDFKNFNI